MRRTATAIFISLLSPLAALAQPPPPPPVPGAETPPPPPPAAEPAPAVMAPAPMAPMTTSSAPMSTGPIVWEGLVDTYYMYNITGDPSTQPPVGRAFDTISNSFTLNYTEVSASMNADPVGFRIDLGYGATGAIINGFAGAGSGMGTAAKPDPIAAAFYSNAFLVQQAYATAKFSGFTLDAGRFVTSASDEVIESKSNWNYSRSFLFNAVPLVHTGLRLGYKINDMISANLQVINGHNNDPDNNANKTFGGQVAVTASPATSVFVTTYIGNEGAPTGDKTAMLFDLVVAQTVSDTVALSLNADYWKAGDPNFWGVGLKARFLLSPDFNLAVRGEYLQGDKGGLGFGTKTSIYEGTVTAICPMGKNYELRLEVRADLSDKEIFMKGAETKKNQVTGTLGFLAWL